MEKTDIFDKNLNSMRARFYEPLVKKLKKMKNTKKFEPFFDLYEPLNLNITELKTKEKMYAKPFEELKERIEEINKEKAKFPMLFFYGIGNGLLYKALLQNKNYKRIVVFEKEIELIFIALCLVDFSEDLYKARLCLVNSPQYDGARADFLFTSREINLLYRSYHLELNCSFYEKYKKDILHINSINKNTMISNSLKRGNDAKDALIGINHFIKHLPKMLTHASLEELIKKRKGKADTAIIVATGPSLDKQLPLLKKYAKKASIFCLDASYPILHEHGIKPDYVLTLERVVATSEFFDNDFGDFDKNVLFVALALTNPKTIEYLERNKREYILTPKTLPLAMDMDFKEYQSLTGMSVSHMAFLLATRLKHKNIIFIGQDLAFGKDDKGHSKNYSRGEEKSKQETNRLAKHTVKAYGGVGTVKTTEVWFLFKNIFEPMFERAKQNFNIYNATEGGARIEHTIEKPFKECCEELLGKDLKKPFVKIKPYKREHQNKLLLYAYKKIKTYQRRGENLAKECRRVSKQMTYFINPQSKQNAKNKPSLTSVYQNLDKIKNKLGTKKYAFLGEVLGPNLHHYESSLAPLYLQNVLSEADKQNKMVAWIYAHEAWVDEVHNLTLLQNGVFKAAIVPLRELLEKRKLI
ncbi:motility associated factor glycosyltransferase family protein [uncultured Campylobacter sp.]|uniref:motility associated factor glycosyltransferase family protein n=1 Tax=uncultured Campylobacter sp. TaxID=218934 RepID=UPI00261A8043|nr:motility associated factor glycosyltransferase family protein [uncultured Campylobacter sp.]